MPVASDTSTSSGKKIVNDNVDYENAVGMVQLFPKGDNSDNSLEYPVVSLNNRSGVRLEFDLLQKNADRKICADCTEKPRRLRIFF